MIETIFSALLPAVITVLLGYFAARHHDFAPQDAPTLIRMVMTYALPVSLFAAAVGTTRAALGADLPMLIVLTIAIIGLYCVIFLVSRFVFHLSLGMCALWALAAAGPSIGFFGPSVVGDLYGAIGVVPVAMANLVEFVTVVPVTVILLSLDQSRSATQPAQLPAHSATSPPAPVAPPRVDVKGKIADALKQPIVWLPLLGFIIVLSGLSMPPLVAHTLDLLGQSAAGVALFAAGIVIAAHKVTVNRSVLSLAFVKNILQPALVLVSMLALGYTSPMVGIAVVTAAFPMLVVIAMLGVQYQVAETEAASVLFISMIGSLITLSAFIAITSG